MSAVTVGQILALFILKHKCMLCMVFDPNYAFPSIKSDYAGGVPFAGVCQY